MTTNKISRNKLKIAILTIGFVLLDAISAHANPIISNLYVLSNDVTLWLFIASSVMLLECILVWRLLRPWIKLRHILPAFLVINIILFPLTQMLGAVIVRNPIIENDSNAAQ